MPDLTPQEKVLGRSFLGHAQEELTRSMESDPPTYRPPNFLGNFRHNCPERNHISTAIRLVEKYVLSPAAEVDGVEIPEGRLGFIYKEGKCAKCGETARSPAGKLVDAWDRPPAKGRVAR